MCSTPLASRIVLACCMVLQQEADDNCDIDADVGGVGVEFVGIGHEFIECNVHHGTSRKCQGAPDKCFSYGEQELSDDSANRCHDTRRQGEQNDFIFCQSARAEWSADGEPFRQIVQCDSEKHEIAGA